MDCMIVDMSMITKVRFIADAENGNDAENGSDTENGNGAENGSDTENGNGAENGNFVIE